MRVTIRRTFSSLLHPPCFYKVKGAFQRLCQRDDGSITISFGLTALVLFMAAGTAIDYGRWQAEATQLQTVADSAVLAAAHKLSNPGTTSAAIVAAVNSFVNPNGSGLQDVKVENVTIDSVRKTVAAKISMPGRRTLSALILTKDPKISVVSRVAYNAAPKGMAICVWALDPGMSRAFEGTGGGTKIAAPGCTVRVNSVSSTSVNFSGGASVASGENCFEGGISQGGAYITPAPKKCGALADPFRIIDVSSVVPSSCAVKNSYSGSATLNPGLYCGGLTLSSGTFTFNPGVYVIKDGVFTATGSSTLRGDGVSFMLMGNNVGLNWSGGSGSYQFKAMSTGPLASFVVYQHPISVSSAKSVISGGGNTRFEGMLYLPTQKLEMSGGSIATGFTVFIAKNFLFSGGSQFNVAVDRNLTSLPIPAAVAGTSGGSSVKLIN
jgi:Flp pilus assembly protein TadG